jgi:hypothetical protein
MRHSLAQILVDTIFEIGSAWDSASYSCDSERSMAGCWQGCAALSHRMKGLRSDSLWASPGRRTGSLVRPQRPPAELPQFTNERRLSPRTQESTKSNSTVRRAFIAGSVGMAYSCEYCSRLLS